MLRDAAGPEHPFEAVLACDDARLSRTAEEWRELADRLSLASVEVVTVMWAGPGQPADGMLYP